MVLRSLVGQCHLYQAVRDIYIYIYIYIRIYTYVYIYIKKKINVIVINSIRRAPTWHIAYRI